jgi:hypothetical protein
MHKNSKTCIDKYRHIRFYKYIDMNLNLTCAIVSSTQLAVASTAPPHLKTWLKTGTILVAEATTIFKELNILFKSPNAVNPRVSGTIPVYMKLCAKFQKDISYQTAASIRQINADKHT